MKGPELKILFDALSGGLGVTGVDLIGCPDHIEDILALCRVYHLEPTLVEAATGNTNPAIDRLIREIFAERGGARAHRLDAFRRNTDRTALAIPLLLERGLFVMEARSRRTPRLVVRQLQQAGHWFALFMQRPRKAVNAQVAASAQAEELPPPSDELANAANDIAASQATATEIRSSAYGTFNSPFDKMNGSILWWSAFSERLLISTVLRLVKPPFTISARFAGHADYVGFSLAPNAQIMCAMTGERHRLVLHVGPSGEYVLLKDGKPERPGHIVGKIARAERIAGECELRLAAHGYQVKLITQEVLVWETAAEDLVPPPSNPIDISVLVVCTKYSRRLSLLVRSIAEQQNFDLTRAELLIAHVPGLDGTEDIIDCAKLVWPQLRIVPVRFSLNQQTSKGLMINVSATRASGKRILITDADIVFPPGIFHRLETEFADDRCVAVAGRKMLDKQTTAELLCGLRSATNEFNALVTGPGESRIHEAKGVPIGFFQCVQRDDFFEVNYDQLPHFEGADSHFAIKMGLRFGPWKVIEDAVVLHLDHSGSRWFGTDRQM